MTKTAVAYIRCSKETIQKLSPEAQRASIEAFAQREGVQVVAWHVDAGVSGATPIDQRAGLLAALAGLRGHRFLIVARRDRVARDALVAAMIDRAVESLGAVVQSADGTANGSTPADQFMRTILDAASAYERGLIRSRTKAALQAKKARGEAIGEAPYGFRVEGGRLVPCDVERAAIERARGLKAEGMSTRAIAAELARVGIVSRRTGANYGKSQVARMILAA